VSRIQEGRLRQESALTRLRTRLQFVKNRELWKVAHPRTGLIGCWLTGALLLAMLISLAIDFSGFFVFCTIWLASIFIWAGATNLQFRRFKNSGLDPLWASTAAVAATL
jgi:hypothetical protein